MVYYFGNEEEVIRFSPDGRGRSGSYRFIEIISADTFMYPFFYASAKDYF